MTSAENSKFLDDLSKAISAKDFTAVPEHLFCNLDLIKGLSLVLPIQFVIMNHSESGFELAEGAFPRSTSAMDMGHNFCPDAGSQTIVLLHDVVSWDLIVPVKGREEEFW